MWPNRMPDTPRELYENDEISRRRIQAPHLPDEMHGMRPYTRTSSFFDYPYSQIPLADTLSIIANYEDSSGHAQILSSSLSIDENNICAVILRYRRYWRKCIHLHQMLRYSVSRLIEQCFSTFGKQFMQIKNTANIAMFFPHNITGA